MKPLCLFSLLASLVACGPPSETLSDESLKGSVVPGADNGKKYSYVLLSSTLKDSGAACRALMSWVYDTYARGFASRPVGGLEIGQSPRNRYLVGVWPNQLELDDFELSPNGGNVPEETTAGLFTARQYGFLNLYGGVDVTLQSSIEVVESGTGATGRFKLEVVEGTNRSDHWTQTGCSAQIDFEAWRTDL